jgi:hypothetical protein
VKTSCRQNATHMKLQPRRRVCGASDQGSALVLVLVLLTILALTLGAMFAEAGANLTTSAVVTGQDNKVYAADGGVEIAIQQLRANPSLCRSSMPPGTKIDGLIIKLTCKRTTDQADATLYYSIRSTAKAPAGNQGGADIASNAVVSIGPDPSRPVNIMSWVTVVS